MLYARPFDEDRLALSGDAVRVVEGIPVVGNGGTPFAVSAAGILAYWPSPIGDPAVLHWFDRTGRQIGALGEAGRVGDPELSPDGTRALQGGSLQDGTRVVARTSLPGARSIWSSRRAVP